MRILIDIPEKIYIHLHDGGSIGASLMIENAIKRGTPLPKGHGRLIDADELFDKIQFADFSSSDDVNTALFSIDEAHTIIEAESEEEE